MYKIIPPLKLAMQGKDVANLLEALQFLLNKNIFELSEREKRALREHLQGEINGHYYGEVTAELVRLFQEKHDLTTRRNRGKVDVQTAQKLNSVLEEFGAFRSKEPEHPSIKRKIQPLKPGMRNEAVKLVKKQLKQLDFTITDRSDYFGRSTRQAVEQFQEQNNLKVTGVVNDETSSAIRNAISRQKEKNKPKRRVSLGKVALVKLEKSVDVSPLDMKLSDPDTFRLLQTIAVTELGGFLEYYFKDSPQKISKEIAKIDFLRLIDEQRDVQDELLQLTDGLREKGISQEEIVETKMRIRELEYVGIPQNPLDVDLPLVSHPLTQSLIQEAIVYHLGRIVRLSDEKVKKILDRSSSILSLDDKVLRSIVKEDKSTDAEDKFTDENAKDVRLVVNLYHLLDEDFNFTEYITTDQCEGHIKINAIEDLIKLEKDDWYRIIKRVLRLKPPNNMTAQDYAELLTKRIETFYPNDIPQTYLKFSEVDKILAELEILQPLFERNKTVFSNQEFGTLKTDYLTSIAKKNIHAAFTNLQKFVNRYPGMKMDQVLDEQELSIIKKIEKINKRVGLIHRFQEQNPEFKLLSLAYRLQSKNIVELDLQGMTDLEKQMLVSNMEAMLSIYSLVENINHTIILIEAGYHSAFSLARDLINKIQEKTGLSEKQAKKYSYKAQIEIWGDLA